MRLHGVPEPLPEKKKLRSTKANTLSRFHIFDFLHPNTIQIWHDIKFYIASHIFESKLLHFCNLARHQMKCNVVDIQEIRLTYFHDMLNMFQTIGIS